MESNLIPYIVFISRDEPEKIRGPNKAKRIGYNTEERSVENFINPFSAGQKTVSFASSKVQDQRLHVSSWETRIFQFKLISL